MTDLIIKGMISICGATVAGLLILLLATGCSDGIGGDAGDDHGNIPDDATLITLVPDNDNPQIMTVTLLGELEERGDIDVFRIELADVRTLDVESMKSRDTEGRLFRLLKNGMEEIEEALLNDEDIYSEDISDADLDFAFTRRQLAPGTYFIAVSGFNNFVRGDYELRVRTITDDHPDTPNPAADPVPFDMPMAGNLEWENGGEGDIDVFRIELTNPGTLRVDTSGSFDTSTLITLVAMMEEEREEIANDFFFPIDEPLRAGSYFVEVQGFDFDSFTISTGPYEFTASVGP